MKYFDLNELKEAYVVSKEAYQLQPNYVNFTIKTCNIVYGLDSIINGGPVEKLAGLGVMCFNKQKSFEAYTLCASVQSGCLLRRKGYAKVAKEAVFITAFSTCIGKLLDPVVHIDVQ